ncbi:conserved hypothetical protein [Ruminiclostridium cellulolyticum H10]|uniref:Uncharacterized protein n=1 Tax=Ruminiclostridium cellulolyticum (strain ATCC 35319 / DSM 5812 / JCM 6584 / H10) TaxID=394503 RepID=B8I7P5_RUMCH|nr:conserved hypothetical protein [Ruminiclostridium cellulolyticum H10]
MIDLAVFQQIARDATPKGYETLRSITIRLVVSNCTGEVYFTDLMLQAGSIATGWVGHVCEIKWTNDG